MAGDYPVFVTAPRTSRAPRVIGHALSQSFAGLANVGRRLPQAAPERHGLEVIRGVPYLPGGGPEHQLDVYRPRDAAGPLPGVLYLHGGGFRALSKDTHWLMGIAFARRGYVVFNADYRLAPQHRYPAAAEDACTAWTWLAQNAAAYGADPARLAVAGESAGANLASVVAVASAWERPEPWARAVYDSPVRPRAAVPACGILQVSDTDRLARRRHLRPPVRAVLTDVERSYLPDDRSGLDLSLADPLCVVESVEPTRPPPPFLLPVGTWDPLLDDSRRMAAALTRRGAVGEVRYYPKEVHAFHAFVWRPQARRCWQDMFGFLDTWVRDGGR